MNIDFVSLKAFLTVVDTESIRAASENLNLSISAVSRRISELEIEFGQQLFTRHSRGVEITEAGRLLAAHTRDTFAALDLMCSDMEKLKAGDIGRVMISANGSALVNGLARHIGEFLDTHPNVAIDLQEQLTPDILQHVANGSADIGFLSNTMRLPEGVTTFPYRSDKLVLAVSSTHALAELESVRFSQMLEFQIIGVSETSSLTRLLRKVGGMANSGFSYSYMASTNEIARTMVANNLGIAVLPEKFVAPYTRMLPIRAVPIAEEWASREISMAVRSGEDIAGPARTFFEWIKASPQCDTDTLPSS
ncbi:LysR family transcriptional regulator [Hoeflea sp.]|uniref:LysR family transcriptional regulator n=1 Tax=Hoeflea sp. TaxID=1940281 RepID=UPI003A924B36